MQRFFNVTAGGAGLGIVNYLQNEFLWQITVTTYVDINVVKVFQLHWWKLNPYFPFSRQPHMQASR
jgi:hypothetical protein